MVAILSAVRRGGGWGGGGGGVGVNPHATFV